MSLSQRFAATWLSLVLILSSCASSAPGLMPAPGLKTRNAVVLVIDGPRQSEMWGDPHATYIPMLSQKLKPKGTLFKDFRNNGPTYTNAGHTAICTGVYEELENTKGDDLPTKPGFFHYFRMQSGLPKSKAWVIATKDKLAILADTKDKAWRKYNPSVWSGQGGKGFGAGYGKDADTFEAVKEILSRDQPRLVLINFKEPDSGGHSGDWEKYLKGMRSSDQLAFDLYEFLEGHPFYAGQTALLITHDHGRHLNGVSNGFVDHGCSCEGCRSVALLAIGPDFKAGAVIRRMGEQTDIPATLGRLLGFPVPMGLGRPLLEAFKQ